MRASWRLVDPKFKYLQSQCGGIGRHARFKIWFLREWRFESAHWYHSLQENIKPTYVGFFVCEKPQGTVITSATYVEDIRQL